MAEWKITDTYKGLQKALLQEHRFRYEFALVFLLWAGVAVTVLGSLEAMLAPVQGVLDETMAYKVGLWTLAAGVVLTMLALGLGHAPKKLTTIGKDKDMGDRYRRMRQWTRLKVLSVLLNLLIGLAVIILGAALLAMLGVFEVSDSTFLTRLSVIQVPLGVALALAVTQGLAHFLSLQAPTRRARSGLEGMFLTLGLAGTSVLLLGGVLLATGELAMPGLPSFEPLDAPFFMLGAVTVAAVLLFPSRGLPTIPALMLEEHEYYRGRSHISRSKSVVMPISVAFAVLFLVVLVLVFFQLSFVGRVQELPTNAVLLAFVSVIVLALVVSAGASWALSRTDETSTLFRKKRSSTERLELALLTGSAVVAAMLFAGAFTLFARGSLPGMGLGQDRWLDLMTFGLLAAIGPFGFYYRFKQRRIRQLEARFPDFLRDLAASRKAGLTLDASVKIAARGEYGALTPEVQKMADQLAWNVPFEEALEQFGDRVDTPLVQRAVSLINEASRSGGHVTDVLEAAARDAREIKNLENERRLTMTLYTAIIYVAFFVFLGVASVLYGTFLPEVLKATQAASATGSQGFGGMSFSSLNMGDYRTFYFIAALTQGVGNGVIAGMMENGNPRSGLSHGFVMVIITWFVFSLVLG